MTSLPADLLAALRQELAASPELQPAEVPEPWALRGGTLGDEPAAIHGYAWSGGALAWLRASLLDGGASAQVFSALALPHPAYDLPLFGAEVVQIRGQVTVVALDWMPLAGGGGHLEALAGLRRRHDHFPPGGELPPWAAEAFSPWALFSRPRGAVPDGDIVAAFRDYLAGYLALCAGAAPHGDPQMTLRAQQHYCGQHFSNDPGGTMLARIFGADWASAYAREFLFRLPPEQAP